MVAPPLRPNEATDLSDPNLESIPPVLLPGGIVGSFRAAIAGVLRTIAAQRNMKIHVVSGLMVLIVGMALPLGLEVRVALLFAVAIVWFAEILNTALEAFVDLHIRTYHRLAMMAKDAAAAGVLVLACATVVVLAEILTTQWHLVTDNLPAVQRAVVFGVPCAVLELVGLFLVRRGVLALVRLVASLALLAPLAVTTTDPIFAVLAVALVLIAAWARWNFPRKAQGGGVRVLAP
ncbi:MAG: diacylglycerol kinase family protein [Deltaproteobacteria bacterium]|nr:diacylglycerol kinase family protein [Deltaproteobacteria bacterium]